ncbi:MAG: hypothetical protein VZS44_09410 [Bacilli bacterium]|nr:hypothetical protein [Bacilli bacterium]
MKIKFKGTSDFNFKKGNIYILVNLTIDKYVNAYITNNNNEIVFIPYSSLYLFNDNWEIVKE